ncbi:hypothetical protein [Neptunomonas qingdaonensis]|uniref:Uncharacterized protein n=1 Tax=Neptunomonas qingdaonensis TaxID=1045558 RepID=A0A1I2V623_9GAMM|nr:hypothetical protein [Neptunomonas qingdaonensis]SFG84590.1 hypothetical protein SAMN05216175_11577 [Neptunomonas qingdaonensis]
MRVVSQYFLNASQTMILTVIVFLFMSIADPVSAAFCSLRDPVLAIQRLYPGVTRHRSIVRPIDQEIRNQVAARLPFTLHHNEIGKHTLYQVMDDDHLIGFVQARSELSDWGMVEIAWAISPDMRIVGLIFQRCRSSDCNETLKNKVLVAFRGRSFTRLLGLMSADGESLSEEGKAFFSPDSAMPLLMLSSALKTLAVTELAWGDVISAQQK